MNWQRFVCEDVGVGATAVHRSHHSLIMDTVRGAAEKGTLANWVRDTNYRLARGRQLTLAMFA